MARSLTLAAVQMFSRPGQISDNLARAEGLVRQAASGGAQLVLLPEFFNTGYQLSDDNYVLAEWRQGRTWRWLVRLAAELDIHLAGAFLLRREGDIYSTLVMAAPDGRTWMYDKQRPFAWERAYSRPGRGPVIADTSLGRIGLLMGWDCAFPGLFGAYAGRVDLLLVSSGAPRFHDLTLQFPDGERLNLGRLNPVTRRIRDGATGLFRYNIRAQAGALNVPIIQACPAATGHLRTTLPRAALCLLLFTAFHPAAWSRAAQADLARTDIGFFADTRIIPPRGEDSTPGTDADGLALARLTLPDKPPRPLARPRPSGLPPEAYGVEFALHRFMVPLYASAMGRRTQYTARLLLSLAVALTLLYWLGPRRRVSRGRVPGGAATGR